MNWEIIVLLTGLMLFSYWLNYIMGSPMADPGKVQVREILFFIPGWLARRRLKMIGQLHKIEQRHSTDNTMTTDPITKHALKKDQREDVYMAGREFFTWEKSLLCPICFHWWLTVIVGAFLLIFDALGARGDLFLAAFAYLVNHFIIRKIS